jgi:hypothetical protein
VQIDAEKLKQHFLSFTSAVSKTSQIKSKGNSG